MGCSWEIQAQNVVNKTPEKIKGNKHQRKKLPWSLDLP